MDIVEFENNINNLNDKMKELTFMEKETLRQKKSIENELDSLEKNVVLLNKVVNLFKHLLDVLLEKKKEDIQQLVTYGLRTVFDDLDLKFHINIESKYNNIYTTFKTEQVGVSVGDALDSFGGGVVNVESILLRIITLFQTNLSPYLFLDECFSNLSEEYVENCSLLLKKLCERLGLTIFMVTHQPMMLINADKVYKASSKNNNFILEEIKRNE